MLGTAFFAAASKAPKVAVPADYLASVGQIIVDISRFKRGYLGQTVRLWR